MSQSSSTVGLGQPTSTATYRASVTAAITGLLPERVVFHAVFSGVVDVSCLAACILQTFHPAVPSRAAGRHGHRECERRAVQRATDGKLEVG